MHIPKNSIIFKVLTVIAALSVLGFLTYDFPGWSTLTEKSPFIVVVRCTESPTPTRVIDGATYYNPIRSGPMYGVVLSDVEITSVLKGEGVHAGQMETFHSLVSPVKDESYLLFAVACDTNDCYALELYRVVPLGLSFQTEKLAGKTLDEQIKFMLQWRLDNLNRELQRGEEEKKRLEEGLK